MFKIKGKKRNGFTLIELLAVVVLMSVVFSIAVMSLSKTTDKAKTDSYVLSARTLIDAIKNNNIIDNEFSEDDYQAYLTSSNKFKGLIDGMYPDTGAINFYNGKVIEAKLCYKGESIYYFLGDYKNINNEDYCNYSNTLADDNYKITSSLPEELSLHGLNEVIKYKNEEVTEVIVKNNIDEDKIESFVSNRSVNKKVEPLSNKIYENNVTNMASDTSKILDTIPSRDQGELGLCTFYSMAATIETTAVNDKSLSGIDKSSFNLSERHIDYLNSSDGFKNLKNNPYSFGDRLVGSGSSNIRNVKMLFSELTIPEEIQLNNFYKDTNNTKNDTQKVDEKNIFGVKPNYYVKSIVVEPGVSSLTETIKNSRKSKFKSIIDSGKAITVSVCIYQSDNTNNLYSDTINTSKGCGIHTVTIYGYDDSREITGKDGKTYKGFWIAKNSWKSLPIVYVSYDYNKIYESDYMYDSVMKKRDWDNSYDTLNVPNNDNTYTNISNSVKYINKVNNNQDIIKQFSYLRVDSSNTKFSKNSFKIVDVANRDECQKFVGKSYSSISGIEINTPEYSNLGYQYIDVSGEKVIKNDFCIILKNPINGNVGILTKTKSINSDYENSVYKIDNLKLYLETAISKNIQSGNKLEYNIVDRKDGTNAKYTIENNYGVNNLVHSIISFSKAGYYRITKGNSVLDVKIGNPGYELQDPTVTPQVEKVGISCKFSCPTEIIRKQSGTCTLTCSGPNTLTKSTLSKSDFSLSGLLTNLLVVSINDVTSTGSYTASGKMNMNWNIKLTTKSLFLFNHSVSVSLKANALKDSDGTGNSKVTSSSIKIRTK